jgi:hypothetical protein
LDTNQGKGDREFFETLHSLLDSLSPGYRKAFGEHLTSQLLKLQQTQMQEEGDQ